MKISKVQNNNSLSKSFKGYSISPQAKQIAINSPSKMKIANQAKMLFEHSKHIDFNILDNFVPQVTIKQTNEKFLGKIKATLIGTTNAIRISDGKTTLDFVLPLSRTAKGEKTFIDSLDNDASRAIRVAELIKLSAHDYNERHII